MPKNRGKRGRKSARPGEEKANVWAFSKDKNEMKNDQFDAYYKEQAILPEEEWETFQKYNRKTLPTTFRICASGEFSEIVKNNFKTLYFSKMNDLEVDEEVLPAPTPIPWYPKELGWYYGCSRAQLRKLDILKSFHQYLVTETTNGNVTRQEANSMVPPFFLQVKPGHKVLDMCAAPGSKTGQLLDFMHTEEDGEGVKDGGLVIANDADFKRLYLLIHQLKRLGKPSLVVTNHGAEGFPSLKLPPEDNGEFGNIRSKNPVIKANGRVDHRIRFDRILCDVPCSGDGTVRKSPEIWNKWTPGLGNGLHRLQVRIGTRGCGLLEAGGLLVYSTCSLNPMENEAVVAELLRRFKGEMELMDVSHLYPELIRRPGMTKWKVFDNRARPQVWHETYDTVDEQRKFKIKKTMFPPSQEESSWMHLERCMRIYPHLQDTGGFFISVLHKKADFAHPDAGVPRAKDGTDLPDSEDEAQGESDVDSEVEGQPPKRPKIQEKEDPKKVEEPEIVQMIEGMRRFHDKSDYFEIPRDNDLVKQIVEFYGLHDNFPFDRLIARSEKKSLKKVYFVSAPVKELMLADKDGRLNILNAGLEMFRRNRPPKDMADVCPFVLSQEGIPVMLPFMTKRIIYMDETDFVRFLRAEHISSNNDWEALESETLKPQLNDLDFGSFATILRESTNNTKFTPNAMFLVCWRGRKSMSVHMSKEERASLLAKFEDVGLVHAETKPSTSAADAPAEKAAE